MARPLRFRWQGLDPQQQRVAGELIAASPEEARLQLLRQGIRPQRLQAPPRQRLRFRARELAVWLRLLATLLKAGLPLLSALRSTAQQARPPLRALLDALSAEIEAGSSFAEALAQAEGVFSGSLRARIAAAERAGSLSETLADLALDQEKAEALRRKLIKALSYPLAVLLVAMLVAFGLLRFAVPQFAALYASFGGELPAFTRAVLQLSAWTQRLALPAGALLLSAALILRQRYRQQAAFRLRCDTLLLHLPLFGALLRQAALARLARSLASLLAAGVPLAQALQAVADTAGNAAYARTVTRLREQVLSGTLLHAALQDDALFPPLAVQLIQIGESSGQLEAMALRLALLCEEELDARIEAMTRLLEPLLMLILGIMVGGLVLALYLPIFRLGQSL
ncbi:type IV pilus assembly protein PilC [Solimonas aquatica]|uniref:Type IV pilus assembly protein PilC n=1 Tax=Solimonas aquatica TaxID=489703 RepID=A0A1H9GMA2_9GAMM|nr:type II secretion system F family protein [Solimonas aquatica]SEQ51237.1 type IV pilus assembly protein PilC [Solimonas aquatica]